MTPTDPPYVLVYMPGPSAAEPGPLMLCRREQHPDAGTVYRPEDVGRPDELRRRADKLNEL